MQHLSSQTLNEYSYSNQNFDKGTVEVLYKNQNITCPMHQNETGDFYFIHKGRTIYLYWISRH